MVSIYGYNPEKKDKGFLDIYFISISLGLLAAVVLILGGIGVKFFIGIAIKYWIWLIVIFAVLLFLKYQFDKRIRK